MKGKIAVTVLAVFVLLVINLGTSVAPASAALGCTPGYWKQEHHWDNWVGYGPDDLVVDVFEDAVGFVGPEDTLLDALSYHGGKGLEGKARIMLRAATASLLNATYAANLPAGEGDWKFPWLPSTVIYKVSEPLTLDADDDVIRYWLIFRADKFDEINNYDMCPL